MDPYVLPDTEAEAMARWRQAEAVERGKRDACAGIVMGKRLKFLIWEAVADDMRGVSDWDALERVLKSILADVHYYRHIGFNIPPKK